MDASSRRFGLSKSKISMFEQCPKRLWLSVHRPELGNHDVASEARFAAGHEVGSIACSLLPTGAMVEAEPDLAAALTTTRTLLDSGHNQPIFEATLEYDGVLVRIDILEPDGRGSWRMAEVKSSTTAKDYHLGDLATQLWVAENAGLHISSAAIRHINNAFVLERVGEFAGLFSDTELLTKLAETIQKRSEVVAAARATLAGPEPNTAPGAQCSSPFRCEFFDSCQSALPPGPEWPVTVLPNGGGKRWLAQEITDLFKIDREALTNELHRRVYEATSTNEPYHDVYGARSAMAGWAYPRTWLDFETISFAVPSWIGTRPYQQIPFQFSAHIETHDGLIDHREFLSLDGTDPRRHCAEALVAMLPQIGSVIGYNAGFEKARLLELADTFPDLAEKLRSIANRIVDLLPVTRQNWYHRDQRGSWSIKAVLPTMAPELDYSILAVKDGGNAQQVYLEATRGATANRKREIDIALRAYCSHDTEAMMVIASKLQVPSRS
jgi:hypothetical protein